MKKYAAYLLTGMLFLGSLSKAQGSEGLRACDRYIKDFGNDFDGPCDGIPSDVFDKRKTIGLMPAGHGEILGFKAGQDDFPDAQKILGVADQWHSGDAAASEDKVCYVSHDGRQAVLVLAANSEMSKGHVSEVRLMKGEVNFLQNCKIVAAAATDFHTKSGIKLGMTENALKAILGEPTFLDDGLWNYAWQQGKELKPDDPAYSSCYKTDGKAMAFLTSFVTARCINGTLEWFTVSSGSKYECPY